jgi:hypothetical protein
MARAEARMIRPLMMSPNSFAWPAREGTERQSYQPMELTSSEGIGYIYFLGSPCGTRIKAGYSKPARGKSLKRLRTHSEGDAFGLGGDYILLGLLRASYTSEQRLHSYFVDSCVDIKKFGAEIYHAAPLIPYVTWLRDQYYVSTTEEEFWSQTGQVIMDPQMWLPEPARVSQRQSAQTLLTLADPWAFLPSRCITGDDWYTPPEYVSVIRAALGGVIDLDPATHVQANSHPTKGVRATKIYTRAQDGLLQPWAGRVFLNPPFSEWPQWSEKVFAELDRGEITEIVMLGATRTLTAQYFEPMLRRVDGFCIISGRLSFWGVFIDSDSPSPTDGHFLMYIGPEVDRFLRVVEPLGAAWKK